MFCYNCGTQINESENFCSNCGTPINLMQIDSEKQIPTTDLPTCALIENAAKKANILLSVAKVPKKLWIIVGGVAVIFLALVIIISLNQGSRKNAMDAFECYIDAQKKLDANALIDLTPPEYYNYKMNYGIELGETHSEAKERTDYYFGKQRLWVYSNDWLLSDWRTPGYIEHADYNIVAKYSASRHEVSELNSYVKNKFGFKQNISSVTLIIYGVSLISQDQTEIKLFNCNYCLCVEIDNEWYFVSDESWWKTQRGLEYIDKVDWVVEWFRNNN